MSDSRAGHDLRGRAFGDDVTAQAARAGAEVHNIVGVADGFFVVLDDEDRIAQVAQLFEGLDQAVVVALVEADGGLIEHVKHAAQARADLRGQADALAFAAGERGGIAVERKIVQADGAEELEPFDDFAADALGDEGFARREVEIRMAAESARFSGSAVKSAMESPPILTASDSGRRRLPRQAGQGVADMKFIMYSR